MAGRSEGVCCRRERVKDHPGVRDVIEVAGASFNAVSRVSKGECDGRRETAERVLTAARSADAAELERAGAELLLKRMAGWSAPPQKIVLPTSLVARGSGEISPGQAVSQSG